MKGEKMSEFEGVVVRNKDSKISFGVSEWKWARLKNPVLYVQVEGHCYKVASFNNREAAEYFIDKVSEFIADLRKGAGNNVESKP